MWNLTHPFSTLRYRAILGPFQWPVWLALTLVYLMAIFPLAFSDKLSLRHLIGNWTEIENMFWYVFGTFTNSLTFTGENSWSNTKKTSTRMLIGEYNAVSFMNLRNNWILYYSRHLLGIHDYHHIVLHGIDHCVCNDARGPGHNRLGGTIEKWLLSVRYAWSWRLGTVVLEFQRWDDGEVDPEVEVRF